MYRALALLQILLMSGITLPGQEISGRVLSASSQTALPNVNIRVEGQASGTSSNREGNFKLACGLPATLILSHVGYHDERVLIERIPSAPLQIKLHEKSRELTQVTIYSNPVVNLLKDKPMHIWDYSLHPNGILMLGTQDKCLWDQRIFQIDDKGDTILSKKTRQGRNLAKDFLGYHHFLTANKAYQIVFNGQDIEFAYPTSIDSFNRVMKPLVAGGNELFIIRQNLFSNQMVNFFLYDGEKDTCFKIRTITDDIGMVRLSDRARLANMPGYTDADARFEEMCFYAPLTTPIFILDENVVLFNTVENYIEVFNRKGEEVNRVPISFHLQKSWSKTILLDESRGRFWTLNDRNGISTISEIDILTGTLLHSEPIPEHPFIEKLDVHDGYLYFLFKEIDGPLKQLYRMVLPGRWENLKS